MAESNNGHPRLQSPRVPPPATVPPRTPSPAPKSKKGRGLLYLILALVVALVVVGALLLKRSHDNSGVADRTQQMAVPTVLVVRPEKGPGQVHIVLPGTVKALIETPIYARVSGYLKRWLVDIGAQVKQGDLLAEIDTPETDEQLNQALAALGQAQANLALSQTTANRYNGLSQSNAVSKQDVDNSNSDLNVKKADLASAEANVHRLQFTQGFKEVYAPFDGIITARQVDVGNLINAGAGTDAQLLFRIAQTKVLRIYVQVPEIYSDLIVPGTPATIEMASAPGQKVTGTLVRTAGGIDPSSLTLLSEVDVDNPEGKLLPGGYAQVHFDVATDHPPLVIPGNALIFRAQGTQVGVVNEQNVVSLKDIKIGRDLGTKIEVSEGIGPEDSIVVNPSDSLTDGQKVQVKTENQKPAP